MNKHSNRNGLTAIILAYALWGLVPIYWKTLDSVDRLVLLQVRLILTALTCLALLPLRKSWPSFVQAIRDPRMLKLHGLAALLLAANWYSFMWAVGSGHVLESSLGYYLCPLVSVILGRFLEKETLRGARLAAVLLAATGVGILIFLVGEVPLAALVIAVSWSSYGLIKKRSSTGPIVSLALETSLLAPIAAVILLVLFFTRPLSIQTGDTPILFYLLLTGVVTTVPLWMFAYGAPKLRLITMGMGQYMVPTAHFFLAVYYGETVTLQVVGAFALIWIGLIVYSFASLQGPRRAESV